MEKSVELEVFFDAYKKAVDKLFSSTEAKQNHLVPANATSFHRTMLRKAGVEPNEISECKAYTEQHLINIVNDTNSKYEEYNNGEYSEGVSSKGKLRYVSFSDVFYTTLESLGFQDIAKGLKYTTLKDTKPVEVAEKSDMQVLEETLNKVGAGPKKQQDEMDELITTLNESVEKISKFVKTYSGALSDENNKKLNSFREALEVVIEDSKRFDGNDKLNAAVERAQGILSDINDKQNIVVENKEEAKVKDVKQVQNIEAMIPAVLEAIPEMLKRGVKASEELTTKNEEINELKNKIEELEKQLEESVSSTKLPNDDDELFNIAKEAVNKISDKGKLKDLGMVIMMKAL